MVKFLFSVHTIIEAKQSNRQAADFPARSFDLERPGVAPPPSASELQRKSRLLVIVVVNQACCLGLGRCCF